MVHLEGKRSMRRVVAAVAVTAALIVAGALPAAAGTASPNDYFFVTGDDQWALTGQTASINAPRAWPIATGYGVLVADVDTGADFGNPDLAGKLVAGARFTTCNGQVTATGQGAVQDDVGHGSMTTGIMAADTNNGQGIAAVAPDARALVVKVLSRTIQTDPITKKSQPTGQGCDTDVAAGIDYAVAHGAKVINLSIGADVPLTGTDGPMVQAVQRAVNADVAVAIAAGNSSLPASDYITLGNTVLVVGALAPNGNTAWYSNSLAGVNVYAPGGDDTYSNDIHGLVVSTNWPDPQYANSDYAIGEGTSFAAPQAAGVLALLRSCGMGGRAAVSRVVSVANSHNGQVDAGAALAGLSGCAVPPSGSSGGGTTSQHSGGGHQVTTTTTLTTRTTTIQPGGPTGAASAQPSLGVLASPGEGNAPGGRAAPPADGGGQGGSGSSGGAPPSALLLLGLVALVVLGAPLGRGVIMRLRGPRGPA
jgi:subtilisin family serine protease